MHVHLLFTEVWRTGGMQAYNRQLMRAVDQILAETEGTIRAFTLNEAGQTKEVRGFDGRPLAYSLAVLRAMRCAPPDAALITHVDLAPLALAYRVLSPRTRVCLNTYGVELERKLPALTFLGLHACHHVLSCSEATRRLVVERHRVPIRKTGVLYYGFESRVGEPGSESVIRAGNPTLLSVARLSSEHRYKGIDTTLRALPMLIKEYPHIMYMIVGDGDDRKRLTTLADDLGVADHTVFAGNVQDKDLQGFYRAADVFVLPSTHEGFGIVYLEALANGVPVVAVHAGGVADVVIHEANGLLLEHKSPDALAAAIDRLLREPGLRDRLGNWGRANTVPLFSLDQMRATVESVLGLSGSSRTAGARQGVLQTVSSMAGRRSVNYHRHQ